MRAQPGAVALLGIAILLQLRTDPVEQLIRGVGLRIVKRNSLERAAKRTGLLRADLAEQPAAQMQDI